MPINQTIDDVAKVLMSRQNMMQAGKYFAEGLQTAGVNSGFQASNPTGVSGVAGGRGTDTSEERSKDAVARKEEAARKTSTKSLEMEARIRKVLNSQYADHSVLVKNLSGALKTISPKMEGFSKDLATMSDSVTQRLQHVSDSFDSYEKEQKFWSKVKKKSGEDLVHLERMRIRNLKLLESGNISPRYRARLQKNMVRIEQRRVKLLDKANDIQEKNNSLASKFSVAALGAMFLDAARKLATDVSAQMRYGSIGTIAQQQARSVTLGGVDPAALSEMNAQARMAVVALGGQTEMYDIMQERQLANWKITGDFGEAARHTTEMMQAMGQAGIRPSVKALDGLTEQFDYLHRMTGMTAEQYRGMFTQLSQNADIRQQLQSLNKNERQRVMAGIQLRIKENVALGMTVEQATRASEALAAMAGEGPKERYKKAAQLQMAAGALGISGGSEAAEALRLGDRASEDQKKILEGVMKEIANARVESRTGNLGMEFAIDRMTQGLPEAGKDSPLITTMTDALRPEGEIAKGIKTTAEQTGVVNSTLMGIALSVSAIEGILSTSALGTAGAAVAGTLGYMARGKIASGAARLFGGGAATGGVGALGTMLGTAGGAGTAAGIGGTALTVGAAGAGAIAGTVGVGLATGGLIGTAANNFAKLWGGRQLSTTLLDAFTGFNDYDPNEDYKHLMKSAEGTEAMVEPAKRTAEASEKQLTLGEKQLQATVAVAELLSGEKGKASAQNRIEQLQNGMQASTV